MTTEEENFEAVKRMARVAHNAARGGNQKLYESMLDVIRHDPRVIVALLVRIETITEVSDGSAADLRLVLSSFMDAVRHDDQKRGG